MEKNDPIEWGLRRDITPRVGARLVQEGNQLHYLADRAGVTGTFNETESRKLNAAFPHFVEQMGLMLLSGELNPRYAHCVTLYHDGFTCEADTLGSYGYVYIVIYLTQR
ncbi:type IV toxin-antitoxin system YeeU family antitoxin [Citrobacter koseri]|uniref:type IV toxin-antitoxin system YeeU family antitoxin n=1 Tax=Citrobacter koseri TaxID=545 RepID=UPI002E34BAF1|nr:type IV toxin-antitoxin system YeeU family antitoxin [Citrobacter koseri]